MFIRSQRANYSMEPSIMEGIDAGMYGRPAEEEWA